MNLKEISLDEHRAIHEAIEAGYLLDAEEASVCPEDGPTEAVAYDRGQTWVLTDEGSLVSHAFGRGVLGEVSPLQFYGLHVDHV
jgi:hypothetical protein